MVENYIAQINALLTKGGFTQKELASRLGVTFVALSRWLHGHAKPHPKRIKAIQRLYLELVRYPAFDKTYVHRLVRRAAGFKTGNLWKKIGQAPSVSEELLVEHTYNSTAIEGTSFTKNETRAVIFLKQSMSNKSLTEHLEVTNHAAVLRKILNADYAPPLTEKLIQVFHLGLLQGIREDAGHYSAHHRAIHGVSMELTHPADIPEEMGLLIRKWRRLKAPTIKDIAQFHSDFELIHPFGDGNGRVGRLLITFQCLTLHYPPVVIENNRKAEYYDVLAYAQQSSIGPFLNFLCEEMEKTNQLLKKQRLVI